MFDLIVQTKKLTTGRDNDESKLSHTKWYGKLRMDIATYLRH